ncbi:MAG: SLC13 family permease [Bacteroidales bacterium]|jgi:di/tricarboxylate transporter
MTATIIILIVTAGLLVWGKIRSDIVALCCLLALTLTNVLTPAEALAGFSNSVVIMIAALFVVGGAITQTGLASAISNRLLKFAGDSSYKLFLLVMLVTSLIGSVLSNTGTVAMLMPIIVSMATKSNANVSRYLMPMAFASSLGGMMTLIGTPPNLIVHNALIEAGYEGLQFFTILPIGIILLAVGIFMLWPLSRVLEKKGKRDDAEGKTTVKSPEQLATDYNVIDNIYRIIVQKGSPIIDKSLADIDITKRYSLIVSEIHVRSLSPLSRSVRAFVPDANTVLSENDILYVIGEYKNVLNFVNENGLTFVDKQADKEIERPKFGGKFKFNEIGMAEVVILHNSRLHNRTVKDSEFRNNYNISILSVQRHDNYIIQNVKDVKMQAGDMLLVQGTWEDIDRFSRLEKEVVVIGQPETEASKVTLSHKAPFAGIILTLMVLAMVFNWLPPVVAVLLAAVSVVLGGCFRTVKDAYRTINWESVVLFAGMMPLATAMEKTGTSALVTSSIIGLVGSYGPYAVLAGILLATSTLTMFISNTATAILFAPIALQAALSMGLSPYPFLIAVTVAASMCFASPFSTPPNAMVMSAGKYNFMDYVKVGLPLQIVQLVIMVFAIPLVFPF